MTKLDDLKPQLKELEATAIQAIRDAQDTWTGCDWDTIDDDPEYKEQCERDAEKARDHGDDAIADIESVDTYGARQDIGWASSEEFQYGDTPAYGPAVEAVEKWAVVADEVKELRAIAKAVKRGEAPVDIVGRVERDYTGDDASVIITLVDALGKDAALDMIRAAGWSGERTEKALSDAY